MNGIHFGHFQREHYYDKHDGQLSKPIFNQSILPGVGGAGDGCDEGSNEGGIEGIREARTAGTTKSIITWGKH